MHLTESVYWLAGGCYGTQGNAYGILHANGLILIDSGEPGAEAIIEKNRRLWGLDKFAVTHVLLTHSHVDHAGCAACYREQGAQVICSAEDAHMLQSGGFPAPWPFDDMDFPPCKADMLLHGDTSFTLCGLEFQSLATPGHSPGSRVYICAKDGYNLLFTGDVASCEGSRGETAALGWKGDPDYNAAQYVESAKKLCTVPADMLFGGHGFPCMVDPSRVLRSTYATALLTR